MKKIKLINLINFQKHKKLTAILDDGLNIIWGDNQRGKSAVIRAIFWVFTNKPLGEWMRPRCGKNKLETIAEIEFDDGFNVKRIRGDENMYIINGEEFTELGSEVPKVLNEYIGDIRLLLGRTTYYPNFLLSDDSVFMVRESGPTKGSMVNYFTGFSLIEQIKKTIQKDIRDNKGTIKGKKSSLQLVSTELTQYDMLDEWIVENRGVQIAGQRLKRMSGCIDKCEQYLKLWLEIDQFTKIGMILGNKIDHLQNGYEKTKEDNAYIGNMIIQVKKYLQAEKQYNDSVSNTVTEESVKKITNSFQKFNNDNHNWETMERLLNTYYNHMKLIPSYEKQLEQVNNQIGQLPDVCEACGQSLKENYNG